MKGLVVVVFVLVILLSAIVIGSQNDGLVTVNYLIAKTQLRISTFMAIMFALGVAVSVAVVSLSWLTLTVKIKRLQQKLRKLQAQEKERR
ncbi:lipopolysaccharide assembly protein LapA domain-containing protein [Aestuariibacter salexigens]|uniref:lipopolysaccharide assembly protein LapA domain-containing protein n=1 Tax=Aestuariibacter salexigens TaxID=226010 RepID=UPI000424857B|nr:lipopolysaccharide assembly protein LapA domain-containing protein [Aestuariibacter salexigens]